MAGSTDAATAAAAAVVDGMNHPSPAGQNAHVCLVEELVALRMIPQGLVLGLFHRPAVDNDR